METEIRNSLKIMPEIFRGFEDYRVIGSVLVAAINGKPHRELHDIDLLIDERVYKKVVDRFEKDGFKKIAKRAMGFSWDEFEKQDYLTFGILLRGDFMDEYFKYKINKFLTLFIDNRYLKPTNYKLYGMNIRGIPLQSIYEGIKAANLNRKRTVDKEIVIKEMGNSLPDGLSLNQAFHVKFAGIEIPYLYTMFSQAYNLIGGVRLAFGKPYDMIY